MTLWRNRPFLVFWLSQTLSVAGSSITVIAVPLLILEATGSVAQMGLLTGLSMAGSVLTGLVAGAAADRFDRRFLMVASDVAQAVLYGLIPIAWAFGPALWLLYVVTPVAAGFGMLFRVSYVTVVPALVGRDQVTEANGRLNTTAAVFTVLGPVLAAGLAAWIGPANALAVDAATFLGSAGLLMLLRFRPEAREAEDGGPVRRFLAGARFLWDQPVLRSLTVALTGTLFVLLGATDVLIYRVKAELGHGETAVGTVMAGGGAGAVLGAMSVGWLRRRFGFGPCWLAGTGLAGLAIAAFGLLPSVPGLAVAAAVSSFGIAVAGTVSMSLRQQITPAHLLGRVTSAFWTLHYALSPAGAVVLTAIAAGHGVRTAALFAGAVVLVCVLGAGFTPVRQRRPELALG
ncbi:MFS transporter [Longispora albida]|uniref:MFS transporter n=1 Tax=Longispora albida TaxID=203523 RepID=UPI0003805933|nr:MFS transporter [Longispora albida]